MGKHTPSGLSISKSGGKFTCSWALPTHGAKDGQKFSSSPGGSKDIGKTTTSKAVTVNFGNYYPYGPVLSGFTFAVKSNPGKHKCGDKQVNPGWSDVKRATYNLYAPPVPSITAELVSDNTCRFSGSVSPGENQPFADIVIETAWTAEEQAPAFYVADVQGSSWAIAPEESDISSGSHTRWVRVYSRGCAGNSGYSVTASHVYAKPKQAYVWSYNVVDNRTGGYDVTLNFVAPISRAYPVDAGGVTIEWAIVSPNPDMSFPSGATWNPARSLNATGGVQGTSFSTDDICGLDECLYVRIKTKHDNQTTEGAATLIWTGKMTAPTLTTFSTNPEQYKATVEFTKNTSINAPTVIYYKTASPNSQPMAIGVATSGSSLIVQCPDWSDEDEIFFGVRSMLGTITSNTRSDGVTVYTIDPVRMASDIDWSDGVAVGQPTGVTARRTEVEGSVRVSWNWSWAKANSAEISWADHEDAWESTDEPKTYTISNMHAASWIIADLELGKEWFVRVRLIIDKPDSKIYSPYSDIVPIGLKSAPDIPAVDISSSVLSIGDDFTISWDYASGDGTLQQTADIAEVIPDDESESGDEDIYRIIKSVETQTYVDLNAAELGWNEEGLHYISVKVKSDSGMLSPWSDPVAVAIAQPVSCEIVDTSLEVAEVVIDSDTGETAEVLSLTEMPLTVEVSGAGIAGTTTIAIVRAAPFHVYRPDESEMDGYEGETVVLMKQIGDEEMTVTRDDLIGAFDDRAQYRLIATVEDTVGQTATDSVDFEVHWSHQALKPTATVSIDDEALIAVITPNAPTGYITGDTCDIYRLSADKPELIYEGAEFGTQYVDPYPTLGEYGGHRIVFRTVDGDYITEDNEIAFYDTDSEDGDLLDLEQTIIDFGGDKVALSYNLEVSGSWEKDFVETKYLGGSVQGDWGRSVSRKTSVTGVAVPADETDTVEAMRRLSVYTGVCHVRTPEGSSFSADVQVSEKWSHKSAGKIVEFTISITRVDPQELAGMTYAEWITEEESES